MHVTIGPLRWRDAFAIARWHYPGPYAIYDIQATALLGMRIYHHALDEQDQLIGFYSFIHRDDEVEVGLALRPDLTGQGLGCAFLQAGLEYAKDLFHPLRFRLDVATFNQRAMRVYERAHFRPVRTFTRQIGREFVECLEMARDA